MARLTAHLVNCWLKGQEFTDLPNRKIRNRIPVTLGGFDAALIRTPESFDMTVGEMKGKQIHTTDMEFGDITPVRHAAARRVAHRTAELLSFALFSQVGVWGFTEDHRGQTFAVRGKALYFRPVFGPALGPEIKKYLEMTYPLYVRLRSRRKLAFIFDYLTTAELPDQPIEVKFVLAMVALESLKSSFAREQGIPFHKGFFRKVSVPPKPNLAREPKYSFGELVSAMCLQVGMRPRTRRLITLRNQLIHFGFSRRPTDSLIESHFLTEDIIREYVLRLLSFRGQFHSYREAGRMITI